MGSGMPNALQRLKPDPIPAIHPVPEYLADARLRAVYEDTKQTLQVPWMGVVAMAFAHFPSFYDTLWGGLRDLAGSREFVQACRDLRAAAEAEADDLPATPLVARLETEGYAAREIAEIEAAIEVFSHGNMPYLLLATAARLLLEGQELSDARGTEPFDGRHAPPSPARLTLMEAHHADAPTRALYNDIKATLGLPFVNTDYRALARWPSYFAMAWSDLKPAVGSAAFAPAVARVHEKALALVRALPNPGSLTSEPLRNAAARDADPADVLAVVRLFQWLLPGLLVNVAFLRRQLMPPVQ